MYHKVAAGSLPVLGAGIVTESLWAAALVAAGLAVATLVPKLKLRRNK